MGFFSFYKTPNHRTFNYQPRYYNPDQDNLDAIVRQAKVEAGLIKDEDLDHDVDRAKMRITRAYKGRAVTRNYKRSSTRKSNIRIVVIIIILTGIAYILLNLNADFLVSFLE